MHAVTVGKRLAVVLLLLAFLMTGFTIISHGNMSMNMDSKMVDCPFMPGVFVCTMTPLEMIAASQYLFRALAQQKDALSTLALLLVALVLLALWKPLLPVRQALLRPLGPPRRMVQPETRSSLLELFSAGILHPKPY